MAMNEHHTDLLDKAIEAWGIDAQLDLACEECAEFIVARNHYRRAKGDGNHVFEEAADTYITMMQIRQIDPARFDEWVRLKMNRLENFLKYPELDTNGGKGYV